MSTPRSTRFAVYFGIDIFFLWQTVAHLFSDARPFDWLSLTIELLVLLVIAYEIFPERRHKRKVRRRVKALNILIAEGQALEDTAPPQRISEDDGLVTKWVADFVSWDRKTFATLASFSKQASASYVHNSAIAGVGFRVHNDVRNHFVTLRSRLENLRSIMEKPDVYF